MTSAELSRTVTDSDTAAAVGSGSLPVLGTPRLLAWAEEATCAALAPGLDAGTTSVGTRIQLEHTPASPVGATVTVSVTQTYRDGRLVRFAVVARHDDGKVVATGEITRLVVEGERFLARVAGGRR